MSNNGAKVQKYFREYRSLCGICCIFAAEIFVERFD